MNDSHHAISDVDLAIDASWIIPIIPKHAIFTDSSLIVDKGKIREICPTEDLHNRYRPKRHITLTGQALMPGLINTHNHAAMTLFRGYADDKSLMDWLENYIWPSERKFVNESFVQAGSELAIAEMLMSGTSCFADMYFLPEVTAKVAHKAGIRTQLNFPILDYPNNWAKSVDESIEKGLALHEQYRHDSLINIGFGPHAPYTVSDEPFTRIAILASQIQAPIQIHLHETEQEVQESIKQYGRRPIERIRDLGILSSSTQCVHMTALNDSDIEILKQTGAHVIHCPESNLKLASGFCPVYQLQSEGINVALGTDGAASNNDLNMLSELKTAALLAKAVAKNAEALSAIDALEMATLNGAKALGIEDQTGSLEAGKDADIIAIDLRGLGQQPLYNPASQILYTDCSHKVTNLWVQGRQLVESSSLTTMDPYVIEKHTSEWRNTLLNHPLN